MQLIDRDSLINTIIKYHLNCNSCESDTNKVIRQSVYNDVLNVIATEHRVNAIPIVQSIWSIKHGLLYDTLTCNRCKYDFKVIRCIHKDDRIWTFCPKCGAVMRQYILED